MCQGLLEDDEQAVPFNSCFERLVSCGDFGRIRNTASGACQRTADTEAEAGLRLQSGRAHAAGTV
jgi:hypothetical protein